MRDEMHRWERENLGPGMPEPEALEQAARGDAPGTTAVVPEPETTEAVAKKPPVKVAGGGEGRQKSSARAAGRRVNRGRRTR